MPATTFLRRKNYAGDTCKNEEFPSATFGKAFCIFRYLGVAKNNLSPIPNGCGSFFGASNVERYSAINSAISLGNTLL